ncbi:MAG: hypothetical protein ACRDD7_17895 [Peptostreptococcaceae bacterium]
MTLQTYKQIKLLYNGLICVELPYCENFKVGSIYRFNDKLQHKGIIRKVKLSKDYKKYSNGTTFLTIELL